MQVIGYAYEAAIHCLDCTHFRFDRLMEDYIQTFISCDTIDSEGNPVHPIFDTDELSTAGEFCSDCGEEITEPWNF